MAKVFISYSSADREKVARLAAALAKHGHEVWWDHNLMPGEDYAEKIELALKGADATVVCWSESAAASDWVRSEADDARARGRLIPVRLDKTMPPKPFDRLHTEDLSSWRGKASDMQIEKVSEMASAMAEGRVPRPVKRRVPIVTLGTLGAVVVGGLAIAANVETLRNVLDPVARQETVEGLKDDIARLEALILAQTAPVDGAPIEAERAAAKAEAATRTARAEPEAARELAAGDLELGFDTLKARARQKAQAAAQEWRDIGALAYDRDPQTALEAYREATRLDGSDFGSWIYRARLEDRQAGNVQAAIEAAKQAIDVAPTERDKAVAFSNVADVLQKLGDLKGAIENYREVSFSMRKLAAANPGSAEAQRDVSVSLNKLGDVAVLAGDLGAARTAFEESHDVLAKLAAANPGSAEAQRDVSISLERLGDVAVKAGDLAAARTAFEESLELARNLAAANPGSAEAQRDVSVSLNKLGDVAVKAGDLGAARTAFEESLEIRRKLAAANPGSAEAQRDVSVSLERLGDVAVKAGDLAAARTAFEESLELARKLAADNPGSAEAQRDVSVSLNKLGDVAVLAGDLAAARTAFEESLELARKLAADNPGSAEAQRDVSVSLVKLGDVAVLAGDLAAARTAFEESHDVLAKLAAANPGSAEAQRDVIVSLAKLAQMTGEVAYWKQALPIVEKLAAEGRLAPADAWMLEDIRSKSAAED